MLLVQCHDKFLSGQIALVIPLLLKISLPHYNIIFGIKTCINIRLIYSKTFSGIS